MTPGLIQRHHDYVLGPNQDARLASVAAGQELTVSLTLDPDAPFVLRSRAMRVKYTAAALSTGPTQTGLNNLLLRWAGPDRDYRSQDLIRQSLLGPYFGQLGNPIPVSPEVIYPRQGMIIVDLYNDGAAALTNVTLYFRGVKLFAPGQVKSYEYPPKFGALPFVYPQGTYSETDRLTLVRNIAVTQGPFRQTFRCRPDADFVIRGGQAGSPFPGFDGQGNPLPVNEIFIRLRDEDEKPYSNDEVHIDVMFGNAAFWSAYPVTAASFVPPVGAGPNSIGLFYPEIYIPKNHLFHFDITRYDASYANAAVANLPITFYGQKVFQK